MKFIAILALTILSSSAFALTPDKVDFTSINLEGLRILDKEDMDTFMYMIKPITKLDAALVQTLEKQSSSKIVSQVYELNQVSAFKNVYVYVGRTEEGTYELVQALHNGSGSFFVIDQDIVNVENDHMELRHGVPAEKLVVRRVGNLPLFKK